MHLEYNQLYFGGMLSTPDFVFFSRKRPFGRYIAGKTAEIGISAFRKEWSDDFLKDVIIHEMIHQYVHERMWGCKYSLVQHGIQFYYVRWQLKRKYGLEISSGSVF